MIPLKKDIPVGLHPMWSAARLNLGICFFNLMIYSTGTTGIISLIAAIFSLGVSLNAFRKIKQETRKELWRKLGGTYAG